MGRLAFYGMASRKPPAPVELVTLLQHGHTVVGFWLLHVFGRPDLNRGPVQELLDYVDRGELKTLHGGTYPLSEARRAHEDIRSRSTTGKLTLDPRR